jgi:hypothetical protein
MNGLVQTDIGPPKATALFATENGPQSARSHAIAPAQSH